MSKEAFNPEKWKNDAALRTFHRKEGVTEEGDITASDHKGVIAETQIVEDIARPTDTEIDEVRARIHTEEANAEANVAMSDEGDITTRE